MTGGRPDWRSGTLLAATVVAVAFAGLLAVATIDPPPLPVRRAKASTVAAPSPAPKIDVVLPVDEPPPAPASTDFATQPPAPSTPSTSTTNQPTTATDWTSLAIDELRTRANANEVAAMEELARRLIQGTGVAKDPQVGAGWLLRAAEAGSPQAAFNVGVIYERGFVVERDSARAVEWYRKAANGNVAAAKHNLALLLRDGKGAARDGKQAIELLRSAARQGMAASMFSLGDIYERGDVGPKDLATALAWFAIAAEFERQTNRGEDTPLAKTAQQRTQSLQRALAPAELERAQQTGQNEFRKIVEALAPAKPAAPPVEPAPPATAAAPPPAPSDEDLPSWPGAAAEQVRVIQQGAGRSPTPARQAGRHPGPMTRNAIREFQRSAGQRDSGEPGKEALPCAASGAGRARYRRKLAAAVAGKIDPPSQRAAEARATYARGAAGRGQGRNRRPRQLSSISQPSRRAPPTTADIGAPYPRSRAESRGPRSCGKRITQARDAQVAAKPTTRASFIDLGKPEPPPARRRLPTSRPAQGRGAQGRCSKGRSAQTRDARDRSYATAAPAAAHRHRQARSAAAAHIGRLRACLRQHRPRLLAQGRQRSGESHPGPAARSQDPARTRHRPERRRDAEGDPGIRGDGWPQGDRRPQQGAVRLAEGDAGADGPKTGSN
jgi:TPR repeat protein